MQELYAAASPEEAAVRRACARNDSATKLRNPLSLDIIEGGSNGLKSRIDCIANLVPKSSLQTLAIAFLVSKCGWRQFWPRLQREPEYGARRDLGLLLRPEAATATAAEAREAQCAPRLRVGASVASASERHAHHPLRAASNFRDAP